MTRPSLDVALVIQNAVTRDGQGRVMVELARELLRRGHRVTVYAHRVDPDLAAEAPAVLIPQSPGPQLLDDVSMLLRASRAVRRGDHDVACVLGHSAVPSCPTVFNAQFSHQGWRASWDRSSRPSLRHRFHVALAARLERWCVRRATHVIASTPTLAGELAPPASIPVTVVPNGVDLAEFLPPSDARRAEARAALRVGPDEFVIAFLGDYATPRKGLEPLVRALAAGPAHERLVVAARGDDRRLRALAETLGVGDRVVRAGFQPPQDVLAAADVLAVPSRYEPFSLVAFEAAATGVPVVIAACAGAAPLLADGAVVIDDPGDPTEIRKALDSVRDDPALRGRLVDAAHTAIAAYEWRRTSAQAADVIEEVARARP